MPTSTDLATEALRRAGIDVPSSDQIGRVKDEHLPSVLEVLFGGRRLPILEAEDGTITLAANSQTFTLPSDFGMIGEDNSGGLSLKYSADPIQWVNLTWVEREDFTNLASLPETEGSYPYIWTIDRDTGYVYPVSPSQWTLRLRYYVDINKTSETSHPTLHSSIYTKYREAILSGLVSKIWKDLDDDRYNAGLSEFLGHLRRVMRIERDRNRKRNISVVASTMLGELI